MDIWKQSFGVCRNIEELACARSGITDNCRRDNKGYNKSEKSLA